VKGLAMMQTNSRTGSAGTIMCIALAFAALFLVAVPYAAQAQTVTTLYDFATNSGVTQQPSGER